MTTPTPETGSPPPRPKREKVPKAPKTPAELVILQEQRSRVFSMILAVFLLGQLLMLMGAAGLWFIVSQPVMSQTAAEADKMAVARTMLPVFRLTTLYTLLLMMVTFYTRRAAVEKWPSAFTLNIVLIIMLLLAFPFGTLAAPFMLLFLLPRKWADLRPRNKKAPAATPS